MGGMISQELVLTAPGARPFADVDGDEPRAARSPRRWRRSSPPRSSIPDPTERMRSVDRADLRREVPAGQPRDDGAHPAARSRSAAAGVIGARVAARSGAGFTGQADGGRRPTGWELGGAAARLKDIDGADARAARRRRPAAPGRATGSSSRATSRARARGSGTDAGHALNAEYPDEVNAELICALRSGVSARLAHACRQRATTSGVTQLLLRSSETARRPTSSTGSIPSSARPSWRPRAPS